MPEKPKLRPRHTTEEDRIRAQYKALRAMSRHTWHGWQGANYHIWMPLARQWKRPIREIKRIVGKRANKPRPSAMAESARWFKAGMPGMRQVPVPGDPFLQLRPEDTCRVGTVRTMEEGQRTMRFHEPENENITYEALIRDYPALTGAEWLYANGWYDGPLDGMVMVDGRRLYASIIEELDDGQRVYALRELDDASFAYERQKHEDFTNFVGNHWDFTARKNPEEWTGVKPREEWHKFYDKYDWKTPRKLTGKLVGWTT